MESNELTVTPGPWVWHEVPTEDGGFYSVLWAENGPPFCHEVILPVPCDDDEATIVVWNPKDAEAIAALPETLARIASLTAEVERLSAENKNLHSSLEMTLETYNKTVHAGLDMMLRKEPQ
jgi:hypothetical protein